MTIDKEKIEQHYSEVKGVISQAQGKRIIKTFKMYGI